MELILLSIYFVYFIGYNIYDIIYITLPRTYQRGGYNTHNVPRTYSPEKRIKNENKKPFSLNIYFYLFE